MKDKFLWFTCSIILFDLVLTSLFFEYEANPIVIELGFIWHLVIKLIALFVIIKAYFLIREFSVLGATISLLPICSLYILVSIGNIVVLLNY